MPVTKFRESKAFRINRKIIPKAKEKDIKKKDKKIFKVKVIAKNKIIKKGKIWNIELSVKLFG